MPSFRIEDHQLIAGWIKRGITNAAQRGAMSTALRTVEYITNELIPGEDPQPVDTGAYRAAWHAEKTERGADVVNTLPYGSVIEGGARAGNIKIGKAMIAALAKWVTRKGFGSYSYKTKSGRVKTVKLPVQEAESIAWAIATAMKKRGIFNRNGKQGLRIAERGRAFAMKILADEVEREAARELR